MNTFQKYWSYFSPITIEKTRSKYNSTLIVAIENGSYVLNTAEANFSFGSLHRVFQQVFQQVNLSEKPFKNALVLGCGTGSIPSIIFNELELELKLDAVEIDEKIIDLGTKYFGLDKYPLLNIFNEDALQFIKKDNLKYDLIIVDVFQEMNVPQEFLTPQFFQKVMSIVNQKGMLLFNFVAYNYEKKEEAKKIKNILENQLKLRVEVFQLENINNVFYVKKE